MTDQRPKKKRGDFAPALEADLPVSLLAHRAEIGDQGCYLLHLLYRPNNKPLKTKHIKAEDGWRPLQSSELNPYLGQVRVNGKQTRRLSLLLGTRENPGLLERLGLVERDRLYSAGHFCMHWRLTYRDRTGATERVRLVVKPTRRPWPPPITQPEAGKPAPAKGKGKRASAEA